MLDRLRRFLRDLGDPASGRIGVVDGEVTESDRLAARLSAPPVAVGIAVYAFTRDPLLMVAAMLAAGVVVNVGYRLYRRR